jgi:hypothetical protein
VLAIVDNEQRVAGGERGDKPAVDRSGSLLRDADGLGDRCGDHRRVRHVDQIHEPHPVATGRGDLGRDAEREPGLADTTRTGRGHQAVLAERCGQRCPLAGTPDERGDRYGQAATAGFDQKARHGLCVTGQATAIGELQLPEHRGHVALDGTRRDEQRVGDLRVRHMPGDQGQDLGLPHRDLRGLGRTHSRHAISVPCPSVSSTGVPDPWWTRMCHRSRTANLVYE